MQPSGKRSIRRGDMILKEWSEALEVYRLTTAKHRRVRRSLWVLSKANWYLWACSLVVILTMVLYYLFIFKLIDYEKWTPPLMLLVAAAASVVENDTKGMSPLV